MIGFVILAALMVPLSGFFVCSSLLPELFPSREGKRDLGWSQLGICFASGALVDYLALLLTGRLGQQWMVLAVLTGLGAAKLVRLRPWRLAVQRLPLALFALCVILLGFLQLRFPIYEWDARSLWYFHAKIIFYADGLSRDSGWQNPMIAFSHLDYPKLAPALAAQAAFLAGWWNEFFPQISRLLFFLPALCWVFAFFRVSFSFGLLWLCVFFNVGIVLYSGQMDGWLAIYTLLTLALVVRWRKDPTPVNAAAAILCATLAASGKNEGLIALGLLAVSSAALLRFTRAPKPWGEHPRRWLLFTGIHLAGFFWWKMKAHSWGLESDYQLGSSSMFQNLAKREPGDLGQILGALFVQGEMWKPALFVALVVGLSRFRLGKLRPEWLLGPGFATLYFLVFVVVFWCTPNELTWHLHRAAFRTMLPAKLAFLLTAYLVAEALESQPAASNNVPKVPAHST